ncbi:MAG: extracellular solute-binding protein [Clostridia bacterium]|jgi:arabinogalactan oligomer/maltooligosaccharide transport system substrate-binding protein
MKKFLAIVLAAVMALSMVSFATADGETYDIKIWVAEAAKDLTEKQIADFNANNEFGFKFNATIEAVSEADAATQMITDVEAGGDIYCFAQDQFARLVQAGALDPLGKKASETVIANNDAGTVAAATSGEQLYAYPLTADNGYFMYYDKSVIPDEDVDSLEKLIADCEAAQKYFAFEMQTSAWYLASFFFGTGCRSVWVTDDNGEFISVSDTFDSDNGLIAVKGMKKLVDSPYHLSGGGADQFNQNAAILVSGTWDFAKVQEYLGDNMGVTDLPSFEVDGKEYHLGSFNGCKLLGVKPQVDEMKGAAIHKLAQYLTGAQCQMERFEALAWGPSNLEDQASEAVQANPGLAALIKQAPYSVPQGQIHGSWWDIAKVIGEDVKNATDDAGLQAALDNYQDKIASLFTMSDEVKNAWTAIGTINGTNWDADVTMTKGDDGVWKTDALELHAGEEFKVRQGLSWDNNFPAENFKVEADGTYVITFDEAATTVDIVAQ